MARRKKKKYVALQEEQRANRRTIADAMEVVRQEQGIDDIAHAEIRLAPLQLPSGKSTAVVQVLFPDLGCSVSLPSSPRFRALNATSSQRTVLEISLLDGARICSDNSVVLADGTRLRAVELLPTYLPYNLSQLEERILLHVISLTKSGSSCYRSIREHLPEHMQDRVPDTLGRQLSLGP
jgi:hypothetical protein